MMKKQLTKFINYVMAAVMIIITCSVMTTTTFAANYSCTKSLEELQSLFPDGRYWNHVGLETWDITTTTTSPCTDIHRHGNCKYNGACGCNSYKGKAIQCMGFAYALQDLAFNGFDGYDASENWDYSDAMARLKPGDVIRLYVGNVRHSVFVTDVTGDAITYMDCNGSGGSCIIRHNKSISKTALKSVFLYVTHAPTELARDSANRVNLYETVTVTAKSSLTIRSQPNINSSSVGSLSSGAIVNVCNYPILDSSGYWWRKLVDGRGWVCWDYLETISGTSMVNGNYRIQNANGKYLTYGNNPSNGIDIIMIDDMYGTDYINYQIWNFTPYFYDSQSGAISYRIKPILSSSYSLDSDQTNNEVLHLWESHDTNAQYWTVDIRSDGSLKILSRGSGLVLDIYNASNENYAQVITYPSHDGNNQKFYLTTP